MTVVLSWLGRQALVIYLLCLMGALAYAVVALSAKRKRDASQFSLEREIYQQRMSRAWLVTALFLVLGGIIFVLSSFLSPHLPEPRATTPTPGIGLFTPTPTSFALPTGTLTATQPISPAVVTSPGLSGTATPAPLPTPVPPEVLQPDCPSPNAQLVLPVAGGDVSGQVEVRGTAEINAFAHYKFEVQFPGSDTPNFVYQNSTPVENGVLGVWDVSDPTRYPPGGPYRFRLVVVDIYGNTVVCTIPVNIVSEEE